VDSQKPTRPRVQREDRLEELGGIGIDDMMKFSVGVSLEGETLSPDEIAQLLEASGGLVPLKGKWVEVDREKFARSADALERCRERCSRGGYLVFRRIATAFWGKSRQSGFKTKARQRFANGRA